MKKIIIIIILLGIIVWKTKIIQEKSVYQEYQIKDNIHITELGKIEIPRISVNQKLIEGTDLNALDQNLVGHVKESSLDFKETIILAGHNNKQVFKNLIKLKKGDVIYLTIYQEKQKYCVYSSLEINEADYTYFKKEKTP